MPLIDAIDISESFSASRILADSRHSAGKRLRFLFIAPVVEEAFYDPLKRGMQDAATAMNVEASFTGTPGVDIAEQARMIAAAAQDGYDGIAANLIHPRAFNAAIRQAARTGVPVIAFNTDAGPSCGRLSAVGQNHSAAGSVLGARVAKSLDRSSKVLVTMHDRDVLSLKQRCSAILDELSKRGIPWKTAIAHSTVEESASLIAEMLARDSSIRFVCATGLADTEGAGLAIERNQLARTLRVAGFDLSPQILRLIEKGIVSFTIDQQPYAQGYYPVMQLALYCRYGILPSNIDTGASVITRRSLNFLTQLSNLGLR
jgi:simple sugar transport system substrate-binding protein